jgi:hypothetical protein
MRAVRTITAQLHGRYIAADSSLFNLVSQDMGKESNEQHLKCRAVSADKFGLPQRSQIASKVPYAPNGETRQRQICRAGQGR